MMANTDPVEVTVIVFYETDKAYLMAEAEDRDGVWIAKSLTTGLVEVGRTQPFAILGKNHIQQTGEEGAAIVAITIPEWLAYKKGLI